MKELPIVYEDERLIAINKPHGLLVHRTPMAKDAKVFAVQMLRDQVGHHVYPVHRLDRKTSGVLVFARDEETNASMQRLFRERRIEKKYIAIVRGFVEDSGTIDYPLASSGSNLDIDLHQEALTDFRCIQRFEIHFSSGKHESSRYSLVELKPTTGRFHQLRKHMAHIYHPIIGDRPHGCNKQNRLWKHQFGMDTMFLHAESIRFKDQSGEEIYIKADVSQAFQQALSFLSQNAIAE